MCCGLLWINCGIPYVDLCHAGLQKCWHSVKNVHLIPAIKLWAECHHAKKEPFSFKKLFSHAVCYEKCNFHNILSARKSELITVFQSCESLVFCINMVFHVLHWPQVQSDDKQVHSVKQKFQYLISSIWNFWASFRCFKDLAVPHTSVRLKWAPDHGFRGDKSSAVSTASGLKSSVTSPHRSQNCICKSNICFMFFSKYLFYIPLSLYKHMWRHEVSPRSFWFPRVLINKQHDVSWGARLRLKM